jgi:hypothetical protein
MNPVKQREGQIMRSRVSLIAVILSVCAGCFAAAPSAYEEQLMGGTTRTLSGLPGIMQILPTIDMKLTRQTAAELVKLGPDAVATLAGKLSPEPSDENTTARYALNLLSVYTMRPGAESERIKRPSSPF